MLSILNGLPGFGKTTIVCELARQLKAVHVRIDSIEQAIRNSEALGDPLHDAGYRVGYAIAEVGESTLRARLGLKSQTVSKSFVPMPANIGGVWKRAPPIFRD